VAFILAESNSRAMAQHPSKEYDSIQGSNPKPFFVIQLLEKSYIL
jgi:hypothetical protein